MTSTQTSTHTHEALLTVAELRIAKLVARGASNVEIANMLFVSRRTVEQHLTHIFRKLQISSRVHLALWFVAPEWQSGGISSRQ